jgi:ParB/RepB/Spo0J family partition protein
MNAAAQPQPSPIAVAIVEIPLETIERNPANARTFPAKDSDDPGLVELAASIKAVGLLEPILVRPLPFAPGITHGYQLVAGERRWRAMRLVEGATTIPAIVRELSDVEALEILVTENLQRKDLSPLEEAAGVRALVDQAGWTVADVADRLGRSLHWVAQRAQLTSLSARWLAEVANAKSGISRWPAGHLVLIARLNQAVQDELLKHDLNYCRRDDQATPTRADLERGLADLTRELRRAPWKLWDAALHPDAGACTDCHKRSACHPGLFEDEDLEKPARTDRCLDARCWQEKAHRYMAVRQAELKKEHKGLLLVNGQDAGCREERRKDALDSWAVRDVKKGSAGAVPALVVSGRGAGTLRWVAPPRSETERYSSRPKGKDGKTIPTTLKERRERLERRRKAKAVEIIKAAIEAIEPYPEPIGMVGPLTAVFGTKHQRNSSQWAGYRNGGGQDLGGKPHKAWDLYESLCTDAAKVATELWHQVRLVLLERLAYQGTPTDVKKLWADAEAACKVFGLNASDFLHQAVEAIPEPKSWAGLQADGRPKGTAKLKPKKAAKANRAAAARALDETGDASRPTSVHAEASG